MFVMSDVFDLKDMTERLNGHFQWRENLLGGIAVHGAVWPGYQTMAAFLFECARECGLLDKMQYASYTLPGEHRSREFKATSFHRLIEGKFVKAKEAQSVLFRGDKQASGALYDTVFFGGTGGRTYSRGPKRGVLEQYDANFIFPIIDDQSDLASRLLRLAAKMLGAGYGYYFVRDDLCGPMHYAHGGDLPPYYGPVVDYEQEEMLAWRQFIGTPAMWSRAQPSFRDLFQVNLISERHTAEPIGQLGYLTEWIAAAPGRGRLQDLGDGRWLWTLTDAEMYSIRRLLDEAGLLMSCRDRVYRDLPYARSRIAQPAAATPRVNH